MADRVRTHSGVVAAAVLVAALATACSDGPSERQPDGTVGSGANGTSGSVPFELVATDQLTVSPDGSAVLADCWNGICRWDTADGTLELLPDRGSVAVAPDWSTVAAVDDGAVVLEDLGSGGVVVELDGLPASGVTDGSSVTAVAYSGDGSRVAAAALAGDGGVVMVWAVDGGSEVATFETGSEVHTLAFSPDGERVAASGNGPVEVHDLTSGDSRVLASGDGGTVAWSPDGRRLVGSGADDQPVMWDTTTWQPVAELRGVRLHEAAFAPDGDVLALTSLDDTAVTLWTPTAASVKARDLVGHTDAPGAVAWSSDGDVLYSVSAADGVRAWLPEEREPAPVTFEVPEGR